MDIENVIDIEVDASEAKEGLSAYEVYLKNGGTLSEEEWLESLKGDTGPTGANGKDGKDGKSAYEIWLEAGNTGTEEDFLNSLKGEKGDTPDLTDYAKIEYVLTKTNTTSFTPTSDYNPATKKYVDDSISYSITDALGGSY